MQVAMAVVLLIGSGLTLRSVARLSAVDTGLRVDGLMMTGISFGAGPSRERAIGLYDRVLQELAALPGVTSAGAATTMPIIATSVSGSGFEMRSRQPEAGTSPMTMYSAISAGYFETLGVRLIEGRWLERADIDQQRPVAWVNEALAKQYFGGQALGEFIRIREDAWLEIVGVIGDLRTFGLDQPAKPMTYVPLGNPIERLEVMHAVIRSAGEPGLLAASVRRAVDRVDSTLPVTAVRTMQDVVDASIAQATFTVTLLAIAASIALVLGIVGLYGVITYIVTQRTTEIGVRLALGARPAMVSAMVLRQGVAVAAIGVVIGLAMAAAATRFMSSLLFEVSARDPFTFTAVGVPRRPSGSAAGPEAGHLKRSESENWSFCFPVLWPSC
jgi:predicted permease